MKGIGRYWGYLLFIILITLWWNHSVGPTALIALSAIVSIYFLFQAPAWCGAVNRDGTLCRNNSSGLLLGCRRRQHKWQKLKMTIVPHAWRQANRRLWERPQEGLNTLGAIAGLLSSLVATVMAIVEKSAA